jgi:hypothetical protein
MSVGALVALGAGSAVLSVATSHKSRLVTAAPAPGPLLQASVAGFAGYGLYGPVDQIADDMQVPQIESIPAGASYGTASTWIGAQNAEGAFAQVGITETEDRQTGRSVQTYDGFWSDTARHFHPIRIASVTTGDEVSVEMQLAGSGWVLRFEDVSTGASRTITTGYGAGQRYNFAEWFQEDPVLSADPLRNLPYPSMSPVTFSSLEFDGGPPVLDRDDAQAMDVSDGPLLVPTVFRSDGFTVVPATGYARQYLYDVSGYNLALQGYAIAVNDQRPDSSDDSRVVAESLVLVRALDNFENEIAAQTWPSDIQGNIQALLSKNYLLSIDLREIESDGPTNKVEARVFVDEEIGQRTSELVRAELGLPGPS